jgi:hypothetical protein
MSAKGAKQSDAVLSVNPADSFAKKEKAWRVTAAQIYTAFDRTAMIRAQSPARLSAFDAETGRAVEAYDQKISEAEAAPFNDTGAIKTGLVAAEQKRRFISQRAGERENLLAKIENEITAASEGVPSLPDFLGRICGDIFAEVVARVMPFSKDSGGAAQVARDCDAYKSLADSLRDLRQPAPLTHEQMERICIDRLRLFVEGKISAWLI